jgi:adenine-specific DNA methylase
VDIQTGDFLKWFLFSGTQAERVGGVVGNPPFVRYQYLGAEQQFMAERIFAQQGLPFTRHTNAWVPFVLASLSLLAPGGRLGMVIPSEILHIRHAQSLRKQLLAQCSRTLLIDPEELWFDEALQGVVLLLAEKKGSKAQRGLGVAVRPVRDRAVLRTDPAGVFHEAEFVAEGELDGKWMPTLLSRAERALLDGVRTSGQFSRFDEVADVDVGIVTGCNKFFLVPDEVVEAHGLGPWAHPMFGRSEHVAGVIFGRADHEANRQAGLPSNFLWFDAADAGAFPTSVQAYLTSGVEQGLPKRFKCRVRTPWFRVPSVYAAPVAMLKRAHHFPRLILNEAGAFTTDTAYRIKPNRGSSAELVWGFVNSVTCLCAELEGRHYGGGVLELVPSEIERLLVPKGIECAAALRDLDRRFRANARPEDILREQDEAVLQAAGISAQDRARFHSAWDRLRKRRQRSSSEGLPEPACDDASEGTPDGAR